MNAIDTIKNKVARGLVLDSKGNWVSIASLKAIEHNVLMHLKDGDVLQEGAWASLKNFKTAYTYSGGGGLPPPPKTDHIHATINKIGHTTNKNSLPWTVISLSTGEQNTAPENMIPVIRNISRTESVPDGSSSRHSQLKIIALVSSAIALLSIGVFIAVRLIF